MKKRSIFYLILALLFTNSDYVKADEVKTIPTYEISIDRNSFTTLVLKSVYSKKYNCYITINDYMILAEQPKLSKYVIRAGIPSHKVCIFDQNIEKDISIEELYKYNELPQNYQEILTKNNCKKKDKECKFAVSKGGDYKTYLDVIFDCE